MQRSDQRLTNGNNNFKTEDDKENDDKIAMFQQNVPIKYSDYEIAYHEDGVGYRSPCVSLQPYQGSTSPAAQGRSVREFEEQMVALRKENFNLKLRLYFIEESIPGYSQASNSAEGQDTLLKQLIDSKVEMEILRKEIQEKQDVLKEAATAMTQLEKFQKDTECKYQNMLEEQKQKIQYMEMERDMEKSHSNGDLMNDLLGRSDIPENLNALQRIHELEGLLKQAEGKLDNFQLQISSLDDILAKRDETIREYEDKVKELVFQNAELLESMEHKDKESTNNERMIRGLRITNADLKADNVKLIAAYKHTQDNFNKEMSNVKTYERQMRDQQDALAKMQSTLTIKTANTARLLDHIQDYEKMVTKINIERNIVKRENRFFRTIINKLQMNKNECYTIEKEEIYQKFGHRGECSEKPLDVNVKQNDSNYRDSQQALEPYQNHRHHHPPHPHHEAESEGYKLKQTFCVNVCNGGGCQCFRHHPSSAQKTSSSVDTSCDLMDECCYAVGVGCGGGGVGFKTVQPADNVGDYLHNCCMDLNYKYEPEIPIRYTISSNSLLCNGSNGPTLNPTSLLGCSNTTVACSATGEIMNSALMLKDFQTQQQQQENMQNYGKYTTVDGIRYVCSKFGNFS